MRFAALVVLAGLLLTSSADAAPFTIGDGDLPAVAVDAAGTAYIAWNGSDPQDTAALLPAAARRDRVRRRADAPGRPHHGLDDPAPRLVVGGRVSILVHRAGEATAITQHVRRTAA